jgi:hypothetical protein
MRPASGYVMGQFQGSTRAQMAHLTPSAEPHRRRSREGAHRCLSRQRVFSQVAGLEFVEP